MNLRFEERSYEDALVRRLVAEVQAEYVLRYGGPDAAAVDPDEFLDPAGLFLVGFDSDVPVVTGGWRRMDGATAEIKRMYVVAAARRRGLARLMLAELERTASEAGVRRVVLNTGDQQPEAIALYESSGYERIDGFGHYACTEGAIFFGKKI